MGPITFLLLIFLTSLAAAGGGAILGLALAYSALATLQQINLEVPEELPYDRVAARFGLEGAYYDQRLDSEVRYRATRVGRGFVAMFCAAVLSALLGIGVPLPSFGVS